ncbi:hypothetical protein DY124_06265 [Apilactobacillus micheneri]|uniref:putative HNHc nuclease n=1 Tax=Apilactobacillus micheneri TaxID=1899430 RepID=UPI00112AAE65|nr:putative HNHc nuclease [Apilactobacillus micheneri]TPR43177.1 hypothetical protein DY124_06265 [Apilactobacillus micheneri]TPR47265.1 hypothetical protein DY125_06760 [Apilactobacillus micheneri]
MEINGYITRIRGDTVQIKLKDICDSQQYILNENIGSEVNLLVDDGRTITNDQRKKAWAMLHDISDFTGYSILETEELMKVRFICIESRPKWFSLSDCSIDVAKDFIEFLIKFCLDQDIPFTTKVFDEIQQSYGLRVQLLKHRICFVTGKPGADVDHVETIGSGRNRRHVNQVGMYAWTLTRELHEERHKIGVKSFAKKYQIKPVKLTRELIEELNLSDKGAIEDEVSNK